MGADGPAGLVAKLSRATNSHDLRALVDCFSVDYRNETPAHPARGFVGREQVRRNWEQIFAAVPDLHAEVTDIAVHGNTVWSEWQHRGTRPDGSPHQMRGVVIFEVVDDRATSARFYLEPVEQGGADADMAVRRQIGFDGPA
jgi:ketosteroid isomerase-like protein